MVHRQLALVAALLAAASSLPLNVTVFSAGEAGYYCIKIPYLHATHAGSLLAFAEARGHVGNDSDCSDWARTDLVWKRSTVRSSMCFSVARSGMLVQNLGAQCFTSFSWVLSNTDLF